MELITIKQYKTFSVFAQRDLNTRGVGKIRDSSANVENFPNPSSVYRYIRICKHRKKVLHCFYKITFLRKLKKENSLVQSIDQKRNSYQSRSLVHEACTCNQSLMFCKKDAFQNTGFSHLKCQLKRKKLTHLICNNFPSFSRRRNG